jgi:hypothetical protein
VREFIWEHARGGRALTTGATISLATGDLALEDTQTLLLMAADDDGSEAGAE